MARGLASGVEGQRAVDWGGLSLEVRSCAILRRLAHALGLLGSCQPHSRTGRDLRSQQFHSLFYIGENRLRQGLGPAQRYTGSKLQREDLHPGL